MCMVEVPLPSSITQSLTCPISPFFFFTSFDGNSPSINTPFTFTHRFLVKILTWSSVISDAWSFVFQSCSDSCSILAVEVYIGWICLYSCCSLIDEQLFIFLSYTKYLCWASCGLRVFCSLMGFMVKPNHSCI